ncbi:MAG: ribonuclease R [Cytophagales bacterium]|nr:MAG: ribonuclease R [Cytophagales bacterium]
MNKKKKNKDYSKRSKKTPPTSQLKNRIEKLLHNNPNKTYSLKEILTLTEAIAPIEKEQTAAIVNNMLIEGKLMIVEGKIKSNRTYKTIKGKIDFVNPRFAFLVPDAEFSDIGDLKIDAEKLNSALDGDYVEALIYNKGKKNTENWQAEIQTILTRYRTEFVGRIEISERYAFVIPDNRRMYYDIFVPKDQTQGAKNGQKVIVKVVEWHRLDSNPVGIVTEILGDAGANDTEMHAIMADFNLPVNFPKDVITEAENIEAKIPTKEIAKRRDFRQITTFTIDPEDAKDFDDALSVQRLENGNWEIGVHIADVTHYVPTDSFLDREAYLRGTSVYLVDRVVPMLPERLSNHICSLVPHEDRLTFSAVFEIDEKANIINRWFGKTIIHSDKRFSYEEAQTVLEQKEGVFAQEILFLNQLAYTLREKRYKEGSISFETIEVKFKLDENKKPIAVYIKERKDAHKLIEEFMLLANREVADFVYHLNPDKPLTMVYRTHEEPIEDKLQNFAVFAKRFGYQIQTQGKGIAQSLNHLTKSVEGTAQQNILQNLAVRTMAKAKYTTEDTAHFGLAFPFYTHFTSPIRRYPDMMAHRLLHKYLSNPNPESQTLYEAMCRYASDRERLAAEAERASIKYKQVEYMQQFALNNTAYEGVITGVTEWGFYVEINETKCEGLVRVVDLTDDYYDLDTENYRLVGRRKGRIFGFGDTVKVSIKETNLEKRTIDLYLE